MYNEWMAIKDQLPPNSGYYLVYMPNEARGFDDIMQFYYCDDGNWDDGRGVASAKYYGITHWAYLPAPPQHIKL